ncbi:MAG: DinB family protein [Chloroflexota bacterium]|nr:DinB family protein [Chloroflexota bacterium]
MTIQGEDRRDPPHAAPEKATLEGFLDYHRATLLRKVSGLEDEALRRRLVPSQTTLLGLVKHLAYVERGWFQSVFARLEVEEPPPEDDWRFEPDETAQAIFALYQSEVAISQQIVAGANLDDLARQTGEGLGEEEQRSRQPQSLRWIMVHMIEETARHNGHVDILRELIDGQAGE